MVKVFDIPADFDADKSLPELLSALPQWRLRKALSYRSSIDKFLCAKSFLMLEEMLGLQFGLSRCPEFSFGHDGKPYLDGYPGIFFNMSHCRRGIACAVSDRPVGIDIEIIQYDDDLARTVLNDVELAEVRQSDEPDALFTACWTRKESFLKLRGDGIGDDIRDVLARAEGVSFETATRRSEGYVMTLAEWL